MHFAGFAGKAGVHKTTHTHEIAFLEIFNIRTNTCHMIDDFMTRNYRVGRDAPIIIHHVKIAVASTAIGNFNLDIIPTNSATLNVKTIQGTALLLGAKSFHVSHDLIRSL
jgi:hypothetical protein